MAKQRELSGTLESESEAKLKKQISDAKSKELSGHDIFAPPPEILPRPAVRALALKENFNLGDSAPQDVQTSVGVLTVSDVWMHIHISLFSLSDPLGLPLFPLPWKF